MITSTTDRSERLTGIFTLDVLVSFNQTADCFFFFFAFVSIQITFEVSRIMMISRSSSSSINCRREERERKENTWTCSLSLLVFVRLVSAKRSKISNFDNKYPEDRMNVCQYSEEKIVALLIGKSSESIRLLLAERSSSSIWIKTGSRSTWLIYWRKCRMTDRLLISTGFNKLWSAVCTTLLSASSLWPREQFNTWVNWLSSIETVSCWARAHAPLALDSFLLDRLHHNKNTLCTFRFVICIDWMKYLLVANVYNH